MPDKRLYGRASIRAENVRQRGSLAPRVRMRQYMAEQRKEFLAGRSLKPSVRWRERVETAHVVDVDVIEAEPPQTRVTGPEQAPP